MDHTPTPESKPEATKSGGVNLTAVIIAVVVCVTLLAAMFMLQGKSAAPDTPARSIVASKPEVPAFITWRETKLSGQTQVARIWAKPDGELPLRVLIQIESSVSGEKKVKEVVLERRHTEDPLELGFLEGHTFVPGDRLSVGHRDYTTVTSTCKARK
jgi:hypothetical protein